MNQRSVHHSLPTTALLPWSDPEQARHTARAPQALPDRAAAVHGIALLLHASVELAELLTTLALHVTRVLEFDRFEVLLRDDNQVEHTLYNLHDERGAPDLRGRPASHAEHGLHLRALDHGEAAVFTAPEPQRAVLSVPLRVDDVVLGALGFHAREPGAYDDDDLRLAQVLALPVASAVRNALLYARERRRSQKLRALHHVGAAATTTLDRDALLETACRQISAEFGYYKVNLATIDEHNVRIAPRHRLFHGRSLPADLPADVIPRTHRSLMPTAANERRIVHAADVARHPGYYPEPGSLTRSEVAIPIVFRDRAFGILDVQSQQVHAFTDEDIQLLALLANQLAAGLENCRLYDQVGVLLDTYVPASVARQLRAEPERPVAGGKRRRISVLFADLRGFTRYAEGRDPVQLLQTLNAYLGVATGAVTELGGTLDKFMGDGVMVLFNAPEEQPDHALRAVRAAALIQQRMLRLLPRDAEELCFGIGVNTGDVVVGNIGTSTALNYTAIGDAVNVAKRLQERARSGQVLISGPTYELVRPHVAAEPLGPLQLHNRRGAIHAYLLRSLGTTEP